MRPTFWMCASAFLCLFSIPCLAAPVIEDGYVSDTEYSNGTKTTEIVNNNATSPDNGQQEANIYTDTVSNLGYLDVGVNIDKSYMTMIGGSMQNASNNIGRSDVTFLIGTEASALLIKGGGEIDSLTGTNVLDNPYGAGVVTMPLGTLHQEGATSTYYDSTTGITAGKGVDLAAEVQIPTSLIPSVGGMATLETQPFANAWSSQQVSVVPSGSVPEPASISFLAASSLTLFRRRRTMRS